MPPGPAYNWICVLTSTAEILSHAARYRATQLSSLPPRITRNESNPLKRRRRAEEIGTEERDVSFSDISSAAAAATAAPVPEPPAEFLPVAEDDLVRVDVQAALDLDKPIPDEPTPTPIPISIPSSSTPPPIDTAKITKSTQRIKIIEPTPTPSTDTSTSTSINTTTTTEEPSLTPYPAPAPQQRNLQSSKVPSSRIGRLFHYGGLAASLSYGAASEVLRRTTSGGGGGEKDTTPLMLTEANVKRLVSKLSQMRGAALKVGQFMSIQDTHVLPPEIDAIFRRVQDSAHYMPDWQMEQVLLSSSLPLPPSPLSPFTSFSRTPFASASIGQVHFATLRADHSPTGREMEVAVKIQFPGVLESVGSDLGYLRWLMNGITAGGMGPRGLFLDKTLEVMKQELTDECSYTREASFLRLFGSPEFLGRDERFKVPWVWEEGSSERVLVMERVGGVSVGAVGGGEQGEGLSQRDRDDIASWILELCLKELFEFRTMQTDPNWTNFLWNARTRQIELVDFGATRTYTKPFMDSWFALLQAAANDDREACKEWSLKLGYLTGEEDDIMLDAHISSLSLLATPFKPSTPQPFSFSPSSSSPSDPNSWPSITQQIRSLIPVMLERRKTPPPRETYSLNRKLSGCFLLASRLGAKVDTRAVWEKVVGGYKAG